MSEPRPADRPQADPARHSDAGARWLRNLPATAGELYAEASPGRVPHRAQGGINAGGNYFIVKPFDPEKLLARVAHWTSRRAPQAA
jgi:CheY-like chemotaxis protein